MVAENDGPTAVRKRTLSGSANTMASLTAAATMYRNDSASTTPVGMNLMERRSSRILQRSSVGRRISKAGVQTDGSGSAASFSSGTDAKAPPVSSTVLRLRALARAVRAGQVLGHDATQERRKRYYVMSARSSAAFGRNSSNGEDDDMSFGLDTRVPLHNNDSFKTSRGRVPPSGASTGNEKVSPGKPDKGPSRSGKLPPTMLSQKSKLANSGKLNGESKTKLDSPENPNSNATSNGDINKKTRSGSKSASVAMNTTLQRLGSIRGDLSALLSAFDPQVAPPSSKSQHHQPSIGALAPITHTDNIDARLSCARSLYKLSCEAGAEMSIVQGGAISQIADFTDLEDPRLLRYAAATLANLTAVDDLSVLEQFVKHDGAIALLELSWSPSVDVKLLCATALCRLTHHAVFAALLVRERAMNEFSALLAIPHTRLQVLVVSCILNLIHHGTVLPDKVFLGDPHALQNPLGVLSVVCQQAMIPTTSAFAVEVLFNLSLNRAGCSCALRGGAAEILHSLALQITKAIDAMANGSPTKAQSESSTSIFNGVKTAIANATVPWMANRRALLKLLRLMATTLANFSAMVEHHTLLNGYAMKTLAVLLFPPLRDLRLSNISAPHSPIGRAHLNDIDSRSSSGSSSSSSSSSEGSDEERETGRIRPRHRLHAVAVSCSRVLANFSSSSDFRRHAFSQDVVHMVVRLTVIDHGILPNSFAPESSVDTVDTSDHVENHELTPHRLFARNIVRVLANLSFEEACTAYYMEFPHVLQLLHGIAVHPSNNNDSNTPLKFPFRSGNNLQFQFWLANTVMCEDMKEDALVAILNLARQPVYAGPLLRTLDGKKLALAAEADSGHSSRLRYMYSVVLSNLLFQNHLQQLVFGDQAISALVAGFYFAPRPGHNTKCEQQDCDRESCDGDNPTGHSPEDLARLRALNLANDDDRERFLSAIFIVASELMSASNIERVVKLVAECLQTHLNTISSLRAASSVGSSGASNRSQPSHPTLRGIAQLSPHLQRSVLIRQHPITCYAAATLHAMARSATQRGDKQSVVFGEETIDLLIRVCAAPPKCSLTFSQSSSEAINSSSGAPTVGPGASALQSSSPTPTSILNFCGMTQAFCASALYHLCVSAGGADSADARVIQGLIDCCNEHEETQSLLACSASFAIISFSQNGCRLLLQCQDLARALNRLGRSSHVESQLYAAITACNVSAIQCAWSSSELRDFIVVALLRANSVQAKQIHAKTLSNLLSHVQIRPKVIEDGVLYALMKLSQVLLTGFMGNASSNGTTNPGGNTDASNGSSRSSSSSSTSSGNISLNPAFTLNSVSISSSPGTFELLSIGLQSLFNLSCEHEYHPKLLSNGVMAYLSAVVAARQHSQHQASQGGSSDTTSGTSTSSFGRTASFTSLLSPGPSTPLRQKADNTSPSKSSGPLGSPSRGGPSSLVTNEEVVTHLSLESRRYVLGIICNLASFEENHQELMHAHVSAIIRKCVDSRDVESRASAAMALRNLSCRMPWVEMLCERKTLQLLLALAQPTGGHAIVRQFATQALGNCSLVTDSLHLFVELRVLRAILGLLEATTVDQPPSPETPNLCSNVINYGSSMVETYMAAIKCLHNAALDDSLALQLVEEFVVLRLVPLLEYRSIGTNEEACELVATTIKTLSGKARCAEALLKQRVVSLCALLHRKHPGSVIIANECVNILMMLSTCQQIQASLAETQAVHVIVSICSSPLAEGNVRLREFGSITIRNLTLCAAEHLALFYGDTALETEDDIFVAGEGGEIDGCDSSSYKRSPRRSSSQNGSPHRGVPSGLDEYFDGGYDGENRGSISKRSGVTRLAERHLFYGLKHFQREIESGRASERILLEGCAAMANMSTVHAFRPAMVRAGIISTLLTLHTMEAPRLRSLTNTNGTSQHGLMKRICAATLHRLVVEDGGAASVTDSDRDALVPSILAVLQLTDEELHQVRYECEKVSVYTPQTPAVQVRRFSLIPTPSDMSDVAHSQSPEKTAQEARPDDTSNNIRVGRRRSGFTAGLSGALAGASVFMPTLMIPAATQCVRQAYREQKWMVYVIKTSLSSQAMVPSLERKQLRTIGHPRLSFLDSTENGGEANMSGSTWTTLKSAVLGASSSGSRIGSASASSPTRANASAALAATRQPTLSWSASLLAVRAAAAPAGGYLLGSSTGKYLVLRERDGTEFVAPASASLSPLSGGGGFSSGSGGRASDRRVGSVDLSAAVMSDELSTRSSADLDSIVHQRKFDRHMRISRRNLRKSSGVDVVGGGASTSSGLLPSVQSSSN